MELVRPEWDVALVANTHFTVITSIILRVGFIKNPLIMASNRIYQDITYDSFNDPRLFIHCLNASPPKRLTLGAKVH
jgi:hypothetical protein